MPRANTLHTHRWPRDARAAIALQLRLAGRVAIRGGPRRVRLVAGADVAFASGGDFMAAAVVLLRYPGLDVVETSAVTRRVTFPYVPGLLSFREAPAIIAAWRRLRHRPDLLLCDGQGIAHPRGLGLAAHLGLLLGVPAIGCAKSRLCGTHREPGPRRGDRAALVLDGRVVGSVLRTRDGVRPLYVSPGHLVGLASAVRWVLACGGGFRLPEPTRQADQLVGGVARSLGSPAAAIAISTAGP
jgi:deoxyribonuclease V